jgi:hypothetical protein
VWDRFKAAEDRIDQEVIESEVDAAMRGDVAETALLDRKLAEAEKTAGLLGDGSDPLAALKSKMAADKAAKQPKQIAPPAAAAPAAEAKSVEDAKPADDAPRPQVEIDRDKLEAELAAMRAAMKSDK